MIKRHADNNASSMLGTFYKSLCRYVTSDEKIDSSLHTRIETTAKTVDRNWFFNSEDEAFCEIAHGVSFLG